MLSPDLAELLKNHSVPGIVENECSYYTRINPWDARITPQIGQKTKANRRPQKLRFLPGNFFSSSEALKKVRVLDKFERAQKELRDALENFVPDERRYHPPDPPKNPNALGPYAYDKRASMLRKAVDLTTDVLVRVQYRLLLENTIAEVNKMRLKDADVEEHEVALRLVLKAIAVARSVVERDTDLSTIQKTGTQIKESFELRVKARSIAADVLTDVATRLFVDNLLASMDKVQEIALFIGSMLVANKAIRHARARKRLDRDFEEWKKLKGGGKDLSAKYHDWRQAVDMATDILANAEAKFMRDRLLAPLNEIDLQYKIAATQIAHKATGIARARLITEQRVRVKPTGCVCQTTLNSPNLVPKSKCHPRTDPEEQRRKAELRCSAEDVAVLVMAKALSRAMVEDKLPPLDDIERKQYKYAGTPANFTTKFFFEDENALRCCSRAIVKRAVDRALARRRHGQMVRSPWP